MTTELLDWCSVQTRVPYPWDVVDNLILANKPSREDWGSHVDDIDIQREQRGVAYVVYQIKNCSSYPPHNYLFCIPGYLEVVKCGESETLLRLWTPTVGPSGRSRVPYADFHYMSFADLLSACRRVWEWSPDHPTAQSWRFLLGLVPHLLGGLEPSPPEGERVKSETRNYQERGPSAETKRRAEMFKAIKDEHPDWSYAQVAREATRTARARAGLGEKPPTYKAEDVRNAYRAMGWTWEPARRVR